MSSFTTPLRVEPVDGSSWRLLEPFSYWTTLDGLGVLGRPGVSTRKVIIGADGEEIDAINATGHEREQTRIYIEVPAGYVTDFASVPRPVWAILPPWGDYGKAAVLHDYNYEWKIGTRRWSDDLFLEGMQVLGVSWWKRTAMYRAVRWFGGSVYAKPAPDGWPGIEAIRGR